MGWIFVGRLGPAGGEGFEDVEGLIVGEFLFVGGGSGLELGMLTEAAVDHIEGGATDSVGFVGVEHFDEFDGGDGSEAGDDAAGFAA